MSRRRIPVLFDILIGPFKPKSNWLHAAIFLETADNEKEHAKLHFKDLGLNHR